MSRKPLKPQSSRHVNIYDEDWELMDQLYGVHSEANVGVSSVVRTVIHAFCTKLRAKMDAAQDEAMADLASAELAEGAPVDV